MNNKEDELTDISQGQSGLNNHQVSSKFFSYPLLLLVFVSFFNYADRYILGVLLPSIKADLSLTDAQLGLISGVAFTLFYATLGLPIARLADRYSRRRIISVSMALWSLMTAVCGLVQSFGQFFFARVLVGVGEAGATPPSHSLLSDYYPIEKRARAIAIFSLGAPVGLMVGFIFGGWMADNSSWRYALFALGIPGLIFAALVMFTLKEPPRGQFDDAKAANKILPFSTVLVSLIKSPAFVHMAFATGLYTVVWLGLILWLPSYFTRSFEMTMGSTGLWLALFLGFPQILGMLLSGVLTDRLIPKDIRWYPWIPAVGVFVGMPLMAFAVLSQNPLVALVLLFFAFMISVMQGPASFAGIQGLTQPRMRAMAAATFLLITNLVGGLVGPFAIGKLSDLFRAEYGDDSLRYALLVVVIIFNTWSALHYFLAGRTYKQEFVGQ